MDYLIFGINIVLPLFIIITLGAILKKANIINDNVVDSLSTIVFYFALPAKLFRDTASSDFTEFFNPKLILFAVSATIIGFLVLLLVVLFFEKDWSKASVLIHSGFRSNFVYVGLPLIQSILGKDIVPAASIIMIVILPLYNVLGVILLTFLNNKGNKISIKSLLLNILTNPMILGILLALPFSILHINIPDFINVSLGSLGSIATPMSLILIGTGLKLNFVKGEGKKVVSIALYKVVLQPIIIMALVMQMNFNIDEIISLFILFSVPPANNVFVWAKKMGGDANLASSIIVTSLNISLITLPIGIWLLGVAGVI